MIGKDFCNHCAGELVTPAYRTKVSNTPPESKTTEEIKQEATMTAIYILELYKELDYFSNEARVQMISAALQGRNR
jgi:hypothetical protein